MPTLKPVGHQSTNSRLRDFFTDMMAALTSFGTTSPRYNKQTAMYLPVITSVRSSRDLSSVLTVLWVTLHHLIVWFKAGFSDLLDLHPLMVSFLGRDEGPVSGEGVVDPGVGHQVGLELRQVAVESSVKPEACRD